VGFPSPQLVRVRVPLLLVALPQWGALLQVQSLLMMDR